MTEYAISRDSRRVPLETRVHLRFERFSGFISEYSSNVSPGGMFVKTQSPSPVGTLLDFEFQLGDGYPLIKGTGEVAWIRSDDKGPSHPAGMGIRFLRLSKGSRELIYKMVDEYIHQGGVPFDVEHGPGAGATAVAVDTDEPAVAAEAAPPPLPAPVPAPAPEPESAPVTPAAAPAAPVLASLSLPDLAARTFGPAVEPSVVPPPPVLAAPPPQPSPVPLAAHPAAHPPRRRTAWPAALVALVVVALGVAAFVFQEPLRRRLGLLDDDGAATAETAAPARARATPAPSAAPVAAAAAASDDAIPEPALAGAADEGAAGPAVAVQDAEPAPPVPAPTAVPAAAARPRLTAIRGIDVRQVDGETEVTIRGDGPIATGGYARDRLGGPSPREVIRIRGVERPFDRARVAVGSPHLKQVRIGHHVLPGGDELHVVLDLADPGVVVRAVREVDGALVLRLGRG